MSNNPIMEPAFVSVDLESSLGIIKDDTLDDVARNSSNHNHNNSTDSLMCQPTNSSSEEPIPESVFETLPIMMMTMVNNNQKVTRTSDTYPFANRQQQQPQGHEEEEDAMIMMDESDCSPVEDNKIKKKTQDDKTAAAAGGMSLLDPIPVTDDVAASDLNMMMLLQDDEAKEVLVNRISDWASNSVVQQNENGYNIVPNDHMNWVNSYCTNIDLSETEVDEDDDTLLDIMEKEAKESGFVLENIEDRQAFWTA